MVVDLADTLAVTITVVRLACWGSLQLIVCVAEHEEEGQPSQPRGGCDTCLQP